MLTTLPLFPLSSIVLPGGQLPLRIFEPRYLSMVRGCLKTESDFGICLIEKGSEVGQLASPYPYGTRVQIVDWDLDESGLLMIVTQGVQRFRTVDMSVSEGGYLLGEVELLSPEEETPVPSEYGGLAQLLQRALKNVGPLMEYKETDFADAVWVSYRLVELLPMSAAERHDFVSIGDPIERLVALQDFIGKQTQ